MATYDSWWTWLLSLLFGAPWIAGIIWSYLRGARGSGGTPPSMAELARQRLWPR